MHPMNGFRITLLVLLCLAIGLMFYVVACVIPAQQEAYQIYQTNRQIDQYNLLNEQHQARMKELAPENEADKVAAARQAAEKAQQERQQKITEAEEAGVLAAARRKQEAEMVQKADDELSAQAAIGLVTSYSKDWNSILFKPVTNSPITNGLIIAIRRDNNLVAEAEVDNIDTESGQVSAQLKPAEMGDAATMTPEVGDQVVVSPYESSRDLRALDNSNFGTGSIPVRSSADDGLETAIPVSDSDILPMP